MYGVWFFLVGLSIHVSTRFGLNNEVTLLESHMPYKQCEFVNLPPPVKNYIIKTDIKRSRG